MPSLVPNIFTQFFDNNGNPLAAGTINAYITGTTTNLNTYSDQAGSVANANPIVLDSAGRPPVAIFLGSSTYDFVLKDSLGNTIKTFTAINGASAGGTASLQIPATLALMRALPSGSSDYVMLAGGTAAGDGASYFYYWSTSSTAADDGINVIRPSSNPATGRWLILLQNGDGAASFTATLNGVNAVVTGGGTYVKKGKIVTVTLPDLQGTSNSTSLTITGLPAAILPSTGIGGIPINSVINNGSYYPGMANVGSTGISFEFRSAFGSETTSLFTGSGIKGISSGSAGMTQFAYHL